jgi:hypothetical protein
MDVAEQMAATADKRNISFVLSLGDNIYREGVHGWLSDRFEVNYSYL